MDLEQVNLQAVVGGGNYIRLCTYAAAEPMPGAQKRMKQKEEHRQRMRQEPLRKEDRKEERER